MTRVKGAVSSTRRGLAKSAVLSALLGFLVGCGGGEAPPPSAAPAGPPVRIAVLPFENLTPRSDAGIALTRTFFSALGERPGVSLVETGEVEKAMEDLGIRTTGSLSRDQADSLGARLGVERILLGTVLEVGSVRAPDMDLPSLSVALKLVKAPSGQLVWTKMDTITGMDKETVFGWGRERSASKLASDLARRMLRDMPLRGGPAASAATGSPPAPPAPGPPPAQEDSK
jgi:hypothetical protein